MRIEGSKYNTNNIIFTIYGFQNQVTGNDPNIH